MTNLKKLASFFKMRYPWRSSFNNWPSYHGVLHFSSARKKSAWSTASFSLVGRFTWYANDFCTSKSPSRFPLKDFVFACFRNNGSKSRKSTPKLYRSEILVPVQTLIPYHVNTVWVLLSWFSQSESTVYFLGDQQATIILDLFFATALLL